MSSPNSSQPQSQPPQSQSPTQSPSPNPQSPPSSSPPTAIPTPNPNPNPPIIQALSYSPLKKPQPIPWSHEETLNLIKAYQEKWYSLKRGQLKASQWEEVAITVAARCGLDEPSKSGTQCRHKIEKLRKRYRAEKLKIPLSFNNTNNNHHHWIYYSLMDQLERGPMPISAIAPQQHHQPKSEDVDHSDDDEGDLRFASLRNLKSHDTNIYSSRGGGRRGVVDDGFFRIGRDFGNGFVRGSGFEGGVSKKRKGFGYGDEEEEDEQEVGFEGEDDEEMVNDDKGGGRRSRSRSSNLVGKLSDQIKEFAEKFVKIEKKKLEMIREDEMFRNEMENKKMEMIFVSQQKTVELINKAFDVAASALSKKKMKNNDNKTDL